MLPSEEKLDPRTRRTRQLIEQAFLDLLESKGFADLNVQDVTSHAGINRATFYAHFSDKYALLDHVIRQQFRQELEKRTLNVCTLSADNLRALVVAVCEFVAQTHAHCLPPHGQFEALVENQVREQSHWLLAHWLEKVPTHLPPETTATAASWAIYGLAHHWAHQKNRPPVEQFARQVLPLVAGNLQVSF